MPFTLVPFLYLIIILYNCMPAKHDIASNQAKNRLKKKINKCRKITINALNSHSLGNKKVKSQQALKAYVR